MEQNLPPVPPCKVTWEEYINSEPGKHPTLARTIKTKEKLLPFTPEIAVVSMYIIIVTGIAV